MKLLHVLNGDATFTVFKETQIVGDVIIWREILAEGPVSKSDLWETRSQWIGENFGETSHQYHQKVVIEAKKLQHLDEYSEIILWFEYDLVCQINLVYILSILNETDHTNRLISLICPDQIEGLPNFRGLGELNPTQLNQLLPTKIHLQKADLELATQVWDLYVENNPAKIKTFLERDFGNLQLLYKALQAHSLRFPKTSNQLNHIDEVLLGLIHSGITNKAEIYEAFWAQESIFGMADLQIDLVLKKLGERGLIAPDLVI